MTSSLDVSFRLKRYFKKSVKIVFFPHSIVNVGALKEKYQSPRYCKIDFRKGYRILIMFVYLIQSFNLNYLWACFSFAVFPLSFKWNALFLGRFLRFEEKLFHSAIPFAA